MRETPRNSADMGVVLRGGCSTSDHCRVEASSKFQRLRRIRPRSFSQDERKVRRHRFQKRVSSLQMPEATPTPDQGTEIENLDLPKRSKSLEASRKRNIVPSSGRLGVIVR